MSMINIIQGLVNGGGIVSGPPSTGVDTLLIVFNGESNAVGYGLNSDAPSGEIGVRTGVKILNNTSLVFEALNIGVNNDFEIAGGHGWELGLANQMAAGGIGGFTEVHVVKTGKGGTRIADWAPGGTWFTRMQTRMSAAISALNTAGKTYKIIWWYSQGINDVGTTPTQSWIDGTVAHFAAVRSLYGSTLPIFMTKFTQTRFNINMDDIAATDSLTKVIDYVGATLKPDGVHWDYAGLKTISSRMITQTLSFL